MNEFGETFEVSQETIQNPAIPEHLKGVTQQEVKEIATIAWGLVMPELRGEVVGRPEVSGFDLPANFFAEMSERERALNKTKNIHLVSFPTRGCGHVTGGHEIPCTPSGVDQEVTLSMARTGCLYCDYGRNEREFSVEEMKESIDRAIELSRQKNEGNDIKEYNITPLGSLFDEKEVPAEVRRYYFEQLAEEKKLLKEGERMMVDFESRFEFITEEKVKEMRDILGDDIDIDVGVGTESICEEIRELAGNKKLYPKWKEKIELLKKYDCAVLGHVLVKHPFLTEREAIMDAVATIKYLEKNDLIDVFIVMTMNRRPNTLTPRLEKEGLYELPSIWTVLEIMKKIGYETAKHSKFLGFQNNPDQENVVHGCDGCNDKVVSLILDYHGRPEEYEAIMEAAESTECECKMDWRRRINEKPRTTLTERIALGMDRVLADQQTGFREIQEMVREGKTIAQIREDLDERKVANAGE